MELPEYIETRLFINGEVALCPIDALWVVLDLRATVCRILKREDLRPL